MDLTAASAANRDAPQKKLLEPQAARAFTSLLMNRVARASRYLLASLWLLAGAIAAVHGLVGGGAFADTVQPWRTALARRRRRALRSSLPDRHVGSLTRPATMLVICPTLLRPQATLFQSLTQSPRPPSGTAVAGLQVTTAAGRRIRDRPPPDLAPEIDPSLAGALRHLASSFMTHSDARGAQRCAGLASTRRSGGIDLP